MIHNPPDESLIDDVGQACQCEGLETMPSCSNETKFLVDTSSSILFEGSITGPCHRSFAREPAH